VSPRPAGADNFVKLRRSLDEHLLFRRMTWNQFAMFVWLCLRANPANGVVRTSWVQLESETRLSANHAEQICRALQRKRYVWYPRHQGRRGALRVIELTINKYPTTDGRYTDLSDRFAGGVEAAALTRSSSGRTAVPAAALTRPGSVPRRTATQPTEPGPGRVRRAPIRTEFAPDRARHVSLPTELGPDRRRRVSLPTELGPDRARRRTELARTERRPDPHAPPREFRRSARRVRGVDTPRPTELAPDRRRRASTATELGPDRGRRALIRTELDMKTLEKSRGSAPGRLRSRRERDRETDRDRDPECARAQDRRNGRNRTEARAHTEGRERPDGHDVAPGWREEMAVPVAIRELLAAQPWWRPPGHDGASASLADAEGRPAGSKATAASGSLLDAEGKSAGSKATVASGRPPGGAPR
jgi:hypothetical protein